MIFGLLEQVFDLSILAGIVALHILRDQGLLTLSAETITLLWGVHAGARGLSKNVFAATKEKKPAKTSTKQVAEPRVPKITGGLP